MILTFVILNTNSLSEIRSETNKIFELSKSLKRKRIKEYSKLSQNDSDTSSVLRKESDDHYLSFLLLYFLVQGQEETYSTRLKQLEDRLDA